MKSMCVMKAELKIIEDMLFSSSTDQEIMTMVGVSKTTFYRYKARIYKEHSARFTERKFDNVGFYTEQLHNSQITVEVARTIFDLNLQGLEIIDTVRALDRKVRTYEIVGGNRNNSSGNVKELVRLDNSSISSSNADNNSITTADDNK